MIDPFTLVSDNLSSTGSMSVEQSPGCDRYIPKRKLVKKESLMSEGDRDVDA